MKHRVNYIDMFRLLVAAFLCTLVSMLGVAEAQAYGPKIQVDRLTQVSVNTSNLMFLYGNAQFGGSSSQCANPAAGGLLVIDLSTNAGREMARLATAAHLTQNPIDAIREL